MSVYPAKLAAVVEDYASMYDRQERFETLIDTADRFNDSAKVPPSVAVQPYDEAHRVPACESEAFVWAVPNEDGTLKFYFDVLNPQGLSAKAMGVILDETLSGTPLEEIIKIPSELVFELFGKEISMGKGAGLMGILTAVQAHARQHLG